MAELISIPPAVRTRVPTRTAGRWPVYGTVYGLGTLRGTPVAYVRWDTGALDTCLPETLAIPSTDPVGGDRVHV